MGTPVTDLLNDLGTKNTESFQKAEKMFNDVIACMPYISNALTVIKMLGIMEEKDVLKEALEELRKQIEELINKVIEEIRQHDELERLRRLKDLIHVSETSLDIAVNYLKEPDKYDIKRAYGDSRSAVFSICDEISFRRIYTPALASYFWINGGIRGDITNAPFKVLKRYQIDPPDPTWNYEYVLPMLMEAIACHLVVIRALEPQSYLEKHRTDIQNLAEALHNIHNKILEGFKVVVPREEEIVPLKEFYAPDWAGAPLNTDPVYVDPSPEGLFGPASNIMLRPYGVIESYSTINFWDSYPEYKLPPDAANNLPASLFDFYTRFYVHCMKRKKEVYEAAGLPSVWKVYTDLKILLDEEIPRPQEIFTGWSIRDVVNTIVPLNSFQLSENQEVSLRQLMVSLDHEPYRVSLLEVLEDPLT